MAANSAAGRDGLAFGGVGDQPGRAVLVGGRDPAERQLLGLTGRVDRLDLVPVVARRP